MAKRGKRRKRAQGGSAKELLAASAGGSPADLLGEASRLFAAARYADVRALAGPALAAMAVQAETTARTAHDLVELRYVLAASLVQLGDCEAARAEIARIRESAPAHPGAARMRASRVWARAAHWRRRCFQSSAAGASSSWEGPRRALR